MKCVQTSESKLREAAKGVFLRKGYMGATARDISEAAGVNVALTNYYFRSKEKLFVEIFREVFTTYFNELVSIIDKPIPLREKIIEIIERDFKRLKEDPNLILFMANELHRDGDNLFPEFLVYKNVLRSKLHEQMQAEIETGKMRDISLQCLMPLVMGNLHFMFICKDLVRWMYDFSADEFDSFVEKHKQCVIEMVTGYLFDK